MKKYKSILIITITLFGFDAQALSIKQVGMFEEVRDHLKTKKETLIDKACSRSVGGKLVTSKSKNSLIKSISLKPESRSRKQCLKELTEKCRKNKKSSGCDHLEKAIRYNQAYAYYDKKIKKYKTNKGCRRVEKLSNKSSSVWICDYASRPLLYDRNKPFQRGRKHGITKDRGNFNYMSRHFGRFPAQTTDYIEPIPRYIKDQYFERPAHPKVDVFHCRKGEQGVDGFR